MTRCDVVCKAYTVCCGVQSIHRSTLQPATPKYIETSQCESCACMHAWKTWPLHALLTAKCPSYHSEHTLSSHTRSPPPTPLPNINDCTNTQDESLHLPLPTLLHNMFYGTPPHLLSQQQTMTHRKQLTLTVSGSYETTSIHAERAASTATPLRRILRVDDGDLGPCCSRGTASSITAQFSLLPSC